MDHEKYMQRCMQLALMGQGFVAPNPMVGAVLVYNEVIIGEGYHALYGQAHAEVNCINSVLPQDQSLIKDSTLYVSLEPCAHFGKTPPCTELIINKQIKKVVIGCRDIYKEVNGKGIAQLCEKNIEVIEGILENQCRAINKRFFTFYREERPYIILKWAQSSNGAIAETNGVRVKISNQYTDRLVHKWRHEEAAILVGTATALLDDPQLTNRLWKGTNPVRIVIDRNLKLAHLKLFDTKAITFILNEMEEKVIGSCHFLQVNFNDFLYTSLSRLYEKNIQSVIIEGGAKTLQSFIDAGLWDEARIITNTRLQIEDPLMAPFLKNALLTKEEKYFNDHIQYFTKKIN